MKKINNYKKEICYKNILIINKNKNTKRYNLQKMKFLEKITTKSELTIYVIKCIIIILLIIFETELNFEKQKIFEFIKKKFKNIFLQEKFQQFLQIIFKKKYSEIKIENFQNLSTKKKDCNFNLIKIVFNHLFFFF